MRKILLIIIPLLVLVSSCGGPSSLSEYEEARKEAYLNEDYARAREYLGKAAFMKSSDRDVLYYLGMIAVTGLYVIVLVAFGNPDLGTIGASYLGLVLLGAGLLSLGTFASALTRNQVVAAVIGVVASVSLWLLDILSAVFGKTIGDVIRFVTPSGHYYTFLEGVVDTRDLVYYVSVTFVFLFLAGRVLESRRWRG